MKFTFSASCGFGGTATDTHGKPVGGGQHYVCIQIVDCAGNMHNRDVPVSSRAEAEAYIAEITAIMMQRFSGKPQQAQIEAAHTEFE